MNTLAIPLRLLAITVSAFAASEEQFNLRRSLPSYCVGNLCDVTQFPGNDDNEKIESAIAEALESANKTVYFPNGTYRLNKTITLDEENIHHLKIRGQSVDGVVLESDPIKTNSFGQICFGAMINIDRVHGFTNMFLTIEQLTLDFSANIEDPIFIDGGCSGSGHGIRVGNGWDNGELFLRRLKILKPPGYGIGILNSGSQDKDADNVILASIRIEQAGAAGLITRQSPTGGNSGLTIIDMSVHQIGFNDEGHSKGLDITYSDFYAKQITVVTDAYRMNPKGIAINTGIDIHASNAEMKYVYIEGGTVGLSIANSYTNASVKGLIIKNYEKIGVSIGGQDHVISTGCVYGGYGEETSPVYNRDEQYAASITVSVATTFPQCTSIANVSYF